ncbi:MAG: hypothetical protein JST19_14690 [Bacteroidetes bacterium]|nr:hypothetical protein [Bacteroidota bacterium]
MSEQDAAINDFLLLKKEIKNFPSSRDEFWRNEAKQLIEKYIGEDSDQYKLISGHTFYPNPGTSETDQSQRERGANMIDSCINYIRFNGIKKDNALLPNTYNTNVAFGGNVYQDLSDDNSRNKQINKTSTPQTNSKPPTIEKWQLWIGIIVGIATILGALKTCGYI